MACSVESLIVNYHLTEEGVNKQITDRHMEVISRSSCKKWRSLPAHLDLDSIVEEDIDRLSVNEDQKRHTFFTTWKAKKGSEATYKRLMNALLITECKEDAESLCRLLKQPQPQQQPPPQQQQQQQQQQPEQGASFSTISAPSDITGKELHTLC